MGALQQALETARAEGAELEATCRELTTAYEVARDAARRATGEQWPAGISATMEARLHRVKQYRRAISHSEKEVAGLRAELAEGAKKVRRVERAPDAPPPLPYHT